MNLKNSVINFKSKIVNSIFVLTMFLFASGQMMAQTIINTSHFKAYDDAGVTANTTFGRLNNVETSLILAFQLPAISAEESILDARLQLEITTGSQATSFRALDIDVLPNKTTTISSADMGTGANAQTHFIDGHGVSISEDISLAISQQIASGNVVEGDYIVLELKLGDYAPADKYVKIYATGTPTLTLTVGTPPDPTAPVIETIDDATVFTGYGKKIMVTASDVNKEDHIAFSLDAGSASGFVTLSDNGDGTAQISIANTTVPADEDSYNIIVTATDNSADVLSSTESFVLEVSPVGTVTEIEQNGITWTLLGDVEQGTYANGDNWVVGPVTVINISPESFKYEMTTSASGVELPAIGYDFGDDPYTYQPTPGEYRIVHGSMLNPVADRALNHGWESEFTVWKKGQRVYPGNSDNYKEELNVARADRGDGVYEPINPGKPLVIEANNSLMSTESLDLPARPNLKAAAVLTIVSEDNRPNVGDFRPAYSSADKKSYFNISDLDYSSLGNMSRSDSLMPLTSIEGYFERVWLDYIPEWSGEFSHPVDNMQGSYGAAVASMIGAGAIALNTDFTTSYNGGTPADGETYNDKSKLLMRMVQLGIDYYGVVTGPDNPATDLHDSQTVFRENGGHLTGRKFPILLAGKTLLNNTTGEAAVIANKMLNIATEHPSIVFSEDGQTRYVNQYDTEYSAEPKTEGPSSTSPSGWNYDYRDWSYDWEPYAVSKGLPLGGEYYGMPYTQEDIGLPEYGITYTFKPFVSHKYWNTAYRRCCTHSSMQGIVLAVHAMGLKEVWGHQALFDYVDRFMSVELQIAEVTEAKGSFSMADDNSVEYTEYHPDLKSELKIDNVKGRLPLRPENPEFKWSYSLYKSWKHHRESFGEVWRRYDEGDIYSNGKRNTLGLPKNNIKPEGVKVYPQPVKGNSFTVSLSSSDEKELSVEIYSLTGSLVYSRIVNVASKSIEVSGMGKLPQGVYVLKVKGNDINISQRLLVE